jgi:Trk-type K+ transport system membrane component
VVDFPEKRIFMAVKNDACVHPLPVGEWVLSLLIMAGRLQIFPIVVILRRSFWR